MISLMRKVWPRNRFVKLRDYLSKTYRVTIFFRFLAWKLFNSIFFGKKRWVKIYDKSARIIVRTSDFRAYVISRVGGTQLGKIDIWRRLVAMNPFVCIDIGANYGEFTAAVASTGMKIYSIEANPLLVECLDISFEEYDNIEIINAAASDSDGEMHFYYNPESSGSASVSRNVPQYEKDVCVRSGQIQEEKTKSLRVDNCISTKLGQFPESFVAKIDVEGHDEATFSGMQGLIDNATWWRALIEFSPQALEQAGCDINRFWSNMSTYNGIIIEGSEESIDINLDGCRLPEFPPNDECEVLIGNGIYVNIR